MVQFSIISVLALVDGRLHEGDKADPPPLPAGPDQTTVDHGSPGRKLHHGYGAYNNFGHNNNYPQQKHSFQQHAGSSTSSYGYKTQNSFVSNSMNHQNRNPIRPQPSVQPKQRPQVWQKGVKPQPGPQIFQPAVQPVTTTTTTPPTVVQPGGSQTCNEEPEPLAAVFVVDASRSLNPDMYLRMLNAVCTYIDVLQSKYSDYSERLWMGVVSFSVTAEDKFNGVQKLSERGQITCFDFEQKLARGNDYFAKNFQTVYAKAFTTAKNLFLSAKDISSDVRLEIILFTDGQPTDYYEPMFKRIGDLAVPNVNPQLPPSGDNLVETMLNEFKQGELKIGISTIYVGTKILGVEHLTSILLLLTYVAGCNSYQEVKAVDRQEYRGVYESGEFCPMLYVAGRNLNSVFNEVKSQAASILSVQKQCSHCQFTKPTAHGDLQITCGNGTKCAKDPKCCSELGGAASCNPQFPYLVEEDGKATCKHSLEEHEEQELVNPCPKIAPCKDSDCTGDTGCDVETNECRPICELPAVPGRCRMSKVQYYFNHETGSCEEFRYGGCGGNKNNFKSLEDCQTACTTPVPTTSDPTTSVPTTSDPTTSDPTTSEPTQTPVTSTSVTPKKPCSKRRKSSDSKGPQLFTEALPKRHDEN